MSFNVLNNTYIFIWSWSFVKGLAHATNDHFIFVPPNSKIDSYVGSQLARVLQPSLINSNT